MNYENTCIKKVDVSSLPSTCQELISLLNVPGRFKDIELTLTDETFEVSAVCSLGTTVTFEIGSENVYLKNTPFYAKDDKAKLVHLITQLGHLS